MGRDADRETECSRRRRRAAVYAALGVLDALGGDDGEKENTLRN